MLSYQDFVQSADRSRAMLEAVRQYRQSAFFSDALRAERYFRGENDAIARKTILRARKIETKDAQGRRRTRAAMEDVIGNRIASRFFARFVCQESQYLLQNGCVLDDASRAALGWAFDGALARMSEKALIQGVCWGFWNGDRLDLLEAAEDARSGFAPLYDAFDGQIRAGIRFWQRGEKDPLRMQLFLPDGVSLWLAEGDGAALIRSECYAAPTNGLPILPLWGNPEHRSELGPALRSKIDAYDRILSDFADNLDRANDVYWVLNNFGGTAEDIAETLETIHKLKAVTSLSDGSGSTATAEPKTIDVPYAAREAALTLLRRSLYEDAMALDTEALTGGSLTNVAIRAAFANLDLKCDRFEWQVAHFVRSLLGLLGVDRPMIRFPRQVLTNTLETARALQLTRADLDREAALRLNPLLQPEEADRIRRTTEAEADA